MQSKSSTSPPRWPEIHPASVEVHSIVSVFIRLVMLLLIYSAFIEHPQGRERVKQHHRHLTLFSPQKEKCWIKKVFELHRAEVGGFECAMWFNFRHFLGEASCCDPALLTKEMVLFCQGRKLVKLLFVIRHWVADTFILESRVWMFIL